MAVAVAVRCGALAPVEAALSQPNADVNGLFKGEATPLHIAIWRNSLPIIERLLESKGSPNIRDAESGWTALHRALYWGHLSAAALLLEAGAQVHIHDFKGRTPLDLLSSSLKVFLLSGTASEVYSWGNGANYQLGTGAEGLQLMPNRLDSLHGTPITALAAAKFHSTAIAEDGTLYTWGFGRGGRLGHPEFHIHSGESAVILPRAVAMPGRRPVAAVAAGKHHTVALTRGGEVFTWGSNRDGRLGYTAVDTQPTPRRVASMKQRVIAVAAANRHTVVVAEGGTVYSWGNNLQGQLGYGTSDSASNAVPRIVEAMKGKNITAVAAAKRHTVALTSEGDVYTWGHRIVTPRRVQLAGSRDVARTQSSGNSSTGAWEVVFHRGQNQIARPQAVAICAGAAHSACLDGSGAVLAWRSADPKLQVQEVGGALAGKRVLAISAGKYRTAAVTDEGDVYMWEGWSKPAEFSSGRSTTGERVAQAVGRPEWPSGGGTGGGGSKRQQQQQWTSAGGDDSSGQESAVARSGRKTERAKALVQQRILPKRVEGIKRVTQVAVGEKHSLALQAWCTAPLSLRSKLASSPSLASALSLNIDRAASAAVSEGPTGVPEEDVMLFLSRAHIEAGRQADAAAAAYWRSLEAIQANAARPGSAGRDGPKGAPSLQQLCERTVARHMVEPRSTLALLEFADAAGAELLRQHCLAVAVANLDAVLLEAQYAFQALPRHLLAQLEELQRLQIPRAVAAPAAQPGNEARESMPESPAAGLMQPSSFQGERSFRNQAEASEEAAMARQVRILNKKMQQIEALENRGTPLDAQQRAKVAARPLLESALALLESGTPLSEVQALLAAAKEGAATAEDVLGSSWGSAGLGTSPASTMKPGAPPSMIASHEPCTPSAPTSSSRSSSRRRHRPKQADPVTPSTVSSASSGATPAAAAEDASSAMSAATSFQARLQRASAGGGAQEAAFPAARAALAGSSPLSSSSIVRHVSLSPETPTPGRQQHGFNASPIAQGWGHSPAAEATLVLSGSSWANAAAGTPGASSTDSPIDKQGSAGKRLGKQRKGGLSMFLSGALEKPSSPVVPKPPVIASADTPPWRLSAPAPAALTSLRDIQSQEAAAGTQASGGADSRSRSIGTRAAAAAPAPLDAATAVQPPAPAEGGMRVPLTHLLKKSAPIDMGGSGADAREAAEPKRAPWGGAEGASPPAASAGFKPSLRHIQAEQEQLRESMSRSWGAAGASPNGSRSGHHLMSSWATQSTAVTAAAGTSPRSGFPAGTSPTGLSRRTHSFTQQPSKWFVQDKAPAQAIRSIQTEEAAIKELSKLYGTTNVRLVKADQTSRR